MLLRSCEHSHGSTWHRKVEMTTMHIVGYVRNIQNVELKQNLHPTQEPCEHCCTGHLHQVGKLGTAYELKTLSNFAAFF